MAKYVVMDSTGRYVVRTSDGYWLSLYGSYVFDTEEIKTFIRPYFKKFHVRLKKIKVSNPNDFLKIKIGEDWKVEDCREYVVWFYKGESIDINTQKYVAKKIDNMSTLRAYKNAQEFVEAQKQHGPCMYYNGRLLHPKAILLKKALIMCNYSVCFDEHGGSIGFDWLRDYRWQDGSPCGIVE